MPHSQKTKNRGKTTYFEKNLSKSGKKWEKVVDFLIFIFMFVCSNITVIIQVILSITFDYLLFY